MCHTCLFWIGIEPNDRVCLVGDIPDLQRQSCVHHSQILLSQQISSVTRLFQCLDYPARRKKWENAAVGYIFRNKVLIFMLVAAILVNTNDEKKKFKMTETSSLSN